MLRWKYFVQSEDDAFVKIMEAFTKATGVKVDIARESYEDVQPKASVAANTGAGPGHVLGTNSLPILFPQKCLDVSDVADYLGKKYGGWVASAQVYGKAAAAQVDRYADLLQRQPDELPHLVDGKGGLQEIPRRRPTRFLAYATA